MKTITLLILSCLLVVSATYGQRRFSQKAPKNPKYSAIRHVKGFYAFGSGASYTFDGFGGNINFEYYLGKDRFIELNGIVENENIKLSNISSFLFNPCMNFTVYKYGYSYYLNVKVGAVLGTEHYNNEYFGTMSRFILGEDLGIKNELYLNYYYKIELDAVYRFFQVKRKDYYPVISLKLQYNF